MKTLLRFTGPLFAVIAALLLTAPAGLAAEKTTVFKGVKVNGGSVTHAKEGNKHILKVSDDFQAKIDTPDPHWQVTDSKGTTYLLDRFEIKGGKFNRQITVPVNVKDIAKVQFWCSFAEALLGEASFTSPVAMK
jgi:hypothetical protein